METRLALKVVPWLLAVVMVVLGVMAIVNAFTATLPRDTVGELRLAQREDVRISYHVQGRGALVILIPSLGRAASDFNELAVALAAVGYRTVAVEPRGMRDDSGLDAEDVTLFDLAADVHAVVCAETPAGQTNPFLIGHAFGNRVARAYATRYPEVRGMVLIAAGARVPVDSRIVGALTRSFWIFMPDWWREREIRLAFFAADNPVPDYWLNGWNVRTSRLQTRATSNVPFREWWAGGSAPLLLVQGMQDRVAPPEHAAYPLREEYGQRVAVVEIEHAGRAILPEQPDEVQAAIVDFLAAGTDVGQPDNHGAHGARYRQ